MTAPRLEIDLGRLRHNAATLVERLGALGISVTGVTKATLGSPEVARALLAGGATSIGESRVENLERLRLAGVWCRTTLIRSPMLSQVDRVVRCADTSLNSEPVVLDALSQAAGRLGCEHGVVLMVELGDLREGILPADLLVVARHVEDLPHLVLRGVGTNLACQNGVVPDAGNMAELSLLAVRVETELGRPLEVVSGGNSANLDWALSGAATGRIDDLRLGESLLLGLEPLRRRPIEGLYTDAITLVAEVIESKRKPRRPWGEIGETAFGLAEPAAPEGREPGATDDSWRAIVALGQQDTDPSGLHAPDGITILGASSDHLVLDTGATPRSVGTEVRFGVNYSALVRAMTSPFVRRAFAPDITRRDSRAGAPRG